MRKWTEQDRLSALHEELILDTPPERAFDDIVRAAANAFGVPMAAVSLIDRDRQWFKARVGLDLAETPRHLSFCAHAVRGDATLVVPDATRDPRFADNDFVVGDPSIRFYAGAVVRSESGAPLGALCVLDSASRPNGISPHEAGLLQILADQVSEQIRLRRIVLDHERHAAAQSEAIRAGAGREDRLLRTLHSAGVPWWERDVRSDTVTCSPELAQQFGLDPAVAARGAPVDAFLANVHPRDRGPLEAAMEAAIASGEPFRHDFRILRADGGTIHASARGACLRDAKGQPTWFSGIVIELGADAAEAAA